MSSNILSNLLRDTHVEAVVGSSRELVTILPSDTVSDALSKLREYNLLSLIVIDENRKFLGLLDTLDLTGFLLYVHSHHTKVESINDVISEGNHFFQEKLSVLLEQRDRPSFQVKLDMSLSGIVDEFSKGYYRSAAVTNPAGKAINIITQFDLAKYICQQNVLNYILDFKIENLPFQNKEIYSVSSNAGVLEALRSLRDHKISALGVVDDQNRVIGNFSASDIRKLKGPMDLRLLNSTVTYFLEFLKQEPITAMVCTKSKTIKEVLLRMAQEKIHRLYYVQDDLSLRGVVSFTDVMNFLVREVDHPIKFISQSL